MRCWKYQKLPGKNYQNLQEISLNYKKVPADTKQFQEVLQKLQGSTGMYEKVPECTRKYQKWLEINKNKKRKTRKYYTIPEINKNDQMWPEVTRSDGGDQVDRVDMGDRAVQIRRTMRRRRKEKFFCLQTNESIKCSTRGPRGPKTWMNLMISIFFILS